MAERVNRTWTVGQEFTFQEVEADWAGERRTFYRFSLADLPLSNELYDTIEHAMASAIGEKFTGRRGAGGTAVGTAADWFMRMVGADVYEGMTAAEIRGAQEEQARRERDEWVAQVAARRGER